ncbi:MAG: aspartate aminotransferase family protein [Deltaproteobacteria bacterium]|nr:aspartate aminotransferase family protein [Deltaproteobacteria bacterium]
MPEKKTDKIVKKAQRLLTPALVFHSEITVKRASGLYVTGTDGRRYMDFSSGLATANIGHCPAPVIKAAKRQMDSLIHSGCIFYYESEVELAERLARITPDNIEMFFFSNSGAEAVEGAIKLARHTTGRQGIISFTGAFHGRTLGAVSLTSSKSWYRRRYHPLLPSVYHSPYPYCFRCPMGKQRDMCGMDCFDYLKSILRHQIAPDEVACVIIEPILGEGGYVVPPKEFLSSLSKLCSDEGILLIADEVQTGFGRTGEWFASNHFGLKPDIMVMAKGIASGFPLSALGASRSLMSKWSPGAHGTTFGGNPVSCAAAIATIDTIEKGRVLENARAMGAYAMKRLKAMQKDTPSIGDARGLGMMIGIEFVKKDGSPDKKTLDKIMASCLSKGLIIVECGIDKNVARFMPPLTTTPAQMKKALDIFEEALFE